MLRTSIWVSVFKSEFSQFEFTTTDTRVFNPSFRFITPAVHASVNHPHRFKQGSSQPSNPKSQVTLHSNMQSICLMRRHQSVCTVEVWVFDIPEHKWEVLDWSQLKSRKMKPPETWRKSSLCCLIILDLLNCGHYQAKSQSPGLIWTLVSPWGGTGLLQFSLTGLSKTKATNPSYLHRQCRGGSFLRPFSPSK